MTCVICTTGRPNDVIVETPTSWITAQADAPLPGYVCVVAKEHVEEPFDLPTSSWALFFADCLNSARAARDATGAAKVNYHIQGNTIRHLHMHIYPRHPGDIFDGVPIDGSRATAHRSRDDLIRLAEHIARAL